MIHTSVPISRWVLVANQLAATFQEDGMLEQDEFVPEKKKPKKARTPNFAYSEREQSIGGWGIGLVASAPVIGYVAASFGVGIGAWVGASLLMLAGIAALATPRQMLMMRMQRRGYSQKKS